MKLNLQDQIETDIELIMKDFIDNDDWNTVSNHMIEKMISKDLSKIKLIIYPTILHYDERDIDQSQIWYTCWFTVDEIEVDRALNYFIDKFPELKYKPFKDEDALREYFVPFKRSKKSFFYKIKEHYLMDYFPKNFVTTAFFLNPDYPDGYWNNHTIGSIIL